MQLLQLYYPFYVLVLLVHILNLNGRVYTGNNTTKQCLNSLTCKTVSDKGDAESLPARRTFLYVSVNGVNQVSSRFRLVEYTVHHVFNPRRASYYC
jgi:hypothetical protein